MGIEENINRKYALNTFSDVELAKQKADKIKKETEKIAKQKDFDKRLGDTQQGVWPTNLEALDLYDRMPKREQELNAELAGRAKERIAGKKTVAQKLKEEIEKGIEEK